MKTNESAYSRIHLFHGYGGMTASKCVYPPSRFNAVGHYFRSFLYVFHLSFFDAGHYFSSIRKPFLCEHSSVTVYNDNFLKMISKKSSIHPVRMNPMVTRC